MADKKYTADMTIGEALQVNPDAETVLMGFGMHCCGCPVSQMETLSEAAEVHGANIDDILDELNNLPDNADEGHDGTCPCGCGGHHK